MDKETYKIIKVLMEGIEKLDKNQKYMMGLIEKLQLNLNLK